jgi:hypothetical protein
MFSTVPRPQRWGPTALVRPTAGQASFSAFEQIDRQREAGHEDHDQRGPVTVTLPHLSS